MVSFDRVKTTPSSGPGARRTPAWSGLDAARQAAVSQGARTVGTQHLLLALLAGPQDDAQRALIGSGVSRDGVLEALRAIEGGGSARITPTTKRDVVVSPRVEAILREAQDRSPRDEHGGVRNRDVLAALLDSDDPAMARLILSYIGARRRILDALDERP